MSFKFPNFSLQALQESLPKVDLDLISKSLAATNANALKAVQSYLELIGKQLQPLTNKTGQLLTQQLQQVQQLANASVLVEVSELPADYLRLETHCDLLLKLYTDLIHTTDDTYAKLSYDYPPGTYAITKLREAHIGAAIGNKFTQLKNVSSPQELERILMGGGETEEDVSIQTIDVAKTLYGHLGQVSAKHGDELKASSSALSLALLQISSAYLEVAAARLDQDKKVVSQVHAPLVEALNEQFIHVNELRKRVYIARLAFDTIRARVGDEENDELIAKEDELVSATEEAVGAMKRLLKPSKSINLLKVFVTAQKEYFEVSARKLATALDDLDKIDAKDEDDEFE